MLLPFLLSVLLLYAPLPAVPAAEAWGVIAGGVAVLAVLNAGICWLGTRLALRLQRTSWRLGELAAARVFSFLKGLVVGLVAADVFVLRWPLLVEALLSRHRWVVLADDLLLLLPAVVMVLTVMAFEHQVEVRQGRVALGLGRYLWLRFRVELGIILGPWLALVLVTDVLHALFYDSPHAMLAETLGTGGVLATLVVLSPLLLRRVWSTSPLPEGPLRERLDEFCQRTGFRCREILVWHTHDHLTNAGIIGPFPLLRYVLLTDALVSRCTEDEIEAVFAHEVGHARQHHLAFYLLLALAFLVFNINLMDLLAWLGWVRPLDHILGFDMTLRQAVALLGFAAFYWLVVFGFISRRMEQQADLFSLRKIERPETFLTALEKLGSLNRAPRRLSFWRHFSIGRRVDFLQDVLEDPSVGRRFLLKVSLIKVVTGVAFLAALARLLLARPEVFGL